MEPKRGQWEREPPDPHALTPVYPCLWQVPQRLQTATDQAVCSQQLPRPPPPFPPAAFMAASSFWSVLWRLSAVSTARQSLVVFRCANSCAIIVSRAFDRALALLNAAVTCAGCSETLVLMVAILFRGKMAPLLYCSGFCQICLHLGEPGPPLFLHDRLVPLPFL
jgi:hypothetical protein